MLTVYARIVVHHSYLILFAVTIISTLLTIVPLIFHALPTFTDPVIGFETRGTTLAHRFISWQNLIDETRPSRRLAVNPRDIEDQRRMNRTYNKTRLDKSKYASGKSLRNRARNRHKHNKSYKPGYSKNDFPPLYNSTTRHIHWGYGKNVTYEKEDTSNEKSMKRKQWVSLKNLQSGPLDEVHLLNGTGSCGSPLPDYAHLVITTSDGTSLLTLNNLLSMCKLQSVLVNLGGATYDALCQRPATQEAECCPVWSVPNYIALMSNKTSCLNIVEEDIVRVKAILQQCASYFHSLKLPASCDMEFCAVPTICSQHNAVYNLLSYLLEVNAFSPPKYTYQDVSSSMIFLPLPCSSTVLPYYEKLQQFNMTYDALVISAMDFGLKNALFDLLVIRDTWLVGLGGLFVFLCVWVYARSFLLTFMLFLAITFSIGVAYFMYVYVYNLQFFPFMNLLVIVVVIGIGADDAFLYIKVWKSMRMQHDSNAECRNNCVVVSDEESVVLDIVKESLHHSVLTMFVTTLTTAVAFLASYISYIPAINCFSVFAGTAVLVNFLLMVTWLPATVYILDIKCSRRKFCILKLTFNNISQAWEESLVILNRVIVQVVTKLRIILTLVLGTIGIYSTVVVFYYPGLQLPDSRQFQVFQTSHPFEQYDIKYKEKFFFERYSREWSIGSKMPLRWVWGVKAIDNGNHMNPTSTGYLEFDEDFTVSEPESQLWLLNFCSRLKSQKFYQPTLGPLLPNCFIESFNLFMSRRCIDTIDKIDRSPCCESSVFPYSIEVFDLCIIKAVESLYQTPREFFIPGVAGPKFLRSADPPKVVALVVEFESVVPYSMSYSTMNEFYTNVESWTQNELKTAPPGMKSGWFLSDLQFYDLQGTLASGTVMALILSAGLGFVVLLPATLNLVVSVCALISMAFSVTVTIAVLVLSGWKLNVLESVAISTSAGLAVDFNLHYALSYSNSHGIKSARVISALSSSAGPTAAAGLTTGFAGIFLLQSSVLPYSQIGTFLALIMSISWIYSTFFLCPLLYIFGRDVFKESSEEERHSVSRVSSVCSGLPNLESHELEHLADSNQSNPTQSYSPSSLSATTIVMNDDFNNANDTNMDHTAKSSCREDSQ